MTLRVKEAFETLDSLNKLSLPIQATSLDGTPGHGIVFADRYHINHLTKSGHLTLVEKKGNKKKVPIVKGQLKKQKKSKENE